MNIYKMTWDEARSRAARNFPPSGLAYGIPRGGIYAALLNPGGIAETVEQCDFIVDDIIDSGRTATRWNTHGKRIYALVDKRDPSEPIKDWIQFPWEQEVESDPEDSVTRLLQFIGEDPKRDGLLETPKRVVKAWKEMTVGYGQDPKAILGKDFDSHGYNQMVVCRSIEFNSTCEHHLLPFIGVAHVAYIPGERVVGLSKMARLVDCFAKRLQIQERMTEEVASAMMEALAPQGVGIVIESRHLCMSCRGVQKHKSDMVTCALRGNFMQPQVKDEFFRHIGH